MTTYKARFQALADEMEALAKGLNTHATECGGCGAQRFDAYEEELAARKLLGYADSFAKLAESTTQKPGTKGAEPAPFLSRVIAPDTITPSAMQALVMLSEREAKWDALLTRIAEGDEMRLVARDIQGLVMAREHEGSRLAYAVLARVEPWLKANDVRPGAVL